jgi:hypothetical protein
MRQTSLLLLALLAAAALTTAAQLTSQQPEELSSDMNQPFEDAAMPVNVPASAALSNYTAGLPHAAHNQPRWLPEGAAPNITFFNGTHRITLFNGTGNYTGGHLRGNLTWLAHGNNSKLSGPLSLPSNNTQQLPPPGNFTGQHSPHNASGHLKPPVNFSSQSMPGMRQQHPGGGQQQQGSRPARTLQQMRGQQRFKGQQQLNSSLGNSW